MASFADELHELERAMIGVAHRHCENPDDAEEVLQDARLTIDTIIKRDGKIDQAYALRIVANAARSRGRFQNRKKRRPKVRSVDFDSVNYRLAAQTEPRFNKLEGDPSVFLKAFTAAKAQAASQVLDLLFHHIRLDHIGRARHRDAEKMFSAWAGDRRDFLRSAAWFLAGELPQPDHPGWPTEDEVDKALDQCEQARRLEASPHKCAATITPALARMKLSECSSPRQAEAALRLSNARMLAAIDQMHPITVGNLLKQMGRLSRMLHRDRDRQYWHWKIKQAQSRISYHRGKARPALQACAEIIGQSTPFEFLREARGVLPSTEVHNLAFEWGNRLARAGHHAEAFRWHEAAKAELRDEQHPLFLRRARFYQLYTFLEASPTVEKVVRSASDEMEQICLEEPTRNPRFGMVDIQCQIALLAGRLATNGDFWGLLPPLEAAITQGGYFQAAHRLDQTMARFAPVGEKGGLKKRARRILHTMELDAFHQQILPLFE